MSIKMIDMIVVVIHLDVQHSIVDAEDVTVLGVYVSTPNTVVLLAVILHRLSID